MDAKTATEGSFLKSSGTTTFQIKEINDSYNATQGRVWLTCNLTGPSSGVNGNGILATITFNATARGNTILVFGETKLNDRFSGPIPHTALQGVDLVRVKEEKDVNNDGTVNLSDLIQVARRFGTQKGDPEYYLNFDMNHDDKINISDLIQVARRFGYKDWDNE
jgi:hypothetical protein